MNVKTTDTDIKNKNNQINKNNKTPPIKCNFSKENTTVYNQDVCDYKGLFTYEKIYFDWVDDAIVKYDGFYVDGKNIRFDLNDEEMISYYLLISDNAEEEIFNEIEIFNNDCMSHKPGIYACGGVKFVIFKLSVHGSSLRVKFIESNPRTIAMKTTLETHFFNNYGFKDIFKLLQETIR